MDFREATDDLCDAISHDALAKALGVSVATIRQARLRDEAAAHRAPPKNWRNAVIQLAEDRVQRYRRLIENLGRDDSGNSAANNSEKHYYNQSFNSKNANKISQHSLTSGESHATVR